MTQEIKVIACECPKCADDLSGLDNDRIFVCDKCAIGIDFHKDPPSTCPVKYIEPVHSIDAPLIYLPVWMFNIDSHFETEDPKQLEKSKQHAPQSIYVIGFKMHGLVLFGNLNLQLAYAQPEFNFTKKPRPMSGCHLTSKNARESIKYILLAVIDNKVDITGLSVNIKVKRVSLLGYPFYDHGRHLIDGIFNKKTAAIAFDDLSALRKL